MIFAKVPCVARGTLKIDIFLDFVFLGFLKAFQVIWSSCLASYREHMNELRALLYILTEVPGVLDNVIFLKTLTKPLQKQNAHEIKVCIYRCTISKVSF